MTDEPAPAAGTDGADTFPDKCGVLRDQLHRVIVGQDEVIDDLLTVLFAQGHALIIGVPGLAKTLLVKTLAGTLGWDFKRIQFTPDLMPSDITGTEILQADPGTGERRLRFVHGPVFTNLLLADEINRTPPKTQAALLEAMQEYNVTAAGRNHAIEKPFFVVATQNPIEQEGTYPLPEAQLDRFMFSIHIDYPSRDEEIEIVDETTAHALPAVDQVFAKEDVMQLQELVRSVPVSRHVLRYAVDLVRASRPDSEDAPKHVRRYVEWGAGPRASQCLILGAKVRSLLEGKPAPSTADVRQVAHQVLRHRILPNYNATGEGITAEDIIDELLESVGESNYDGA